MPEDVNAAIERLQTFLGSFHGDLVDEKSGFTVTDGMLLVGEIELAYAQRHADEGMID